MKRLLKRPILYGIWGTIVIMVLLTTGCCLMPERDNMGRKIFLSGTIALPAAQLAGESSEEIPFGFARVVLYGEEGDTIVVETNQEGKWTANGLISSFYLLEAEKDGIVIKQVFSIPSETFNSVGTANAYTSCQVLVFEVANQLFENALYLREVPDLVIPENLLKSVEKAYQDSRNPFSDPDVIRLVKDIVSHQF